MLMLVMKARGFAEAEIVLVVETDHVSFIKYEIEISQR